MKLIFFFESWQMTLRLFSHLWEAMAFQHVAPKSPHRLAVRDLCRNHGSCAVYGLNETNWNWPGIPAKFIRSGGVPSSWLCIRWISISKCYLLGFPQKINLTQKFIPKGPVSPKTKRHVQQKTTRPKFVGCLQWGIHPTRDVDFHTITLVHLPNTHFGAPWGWIHCWRLPRLFCVAFTKKKKKKQELQLSMSLLYKMLFT